MNVKDSVFAHGSDYNYTSSDLIYINIPKQETCAANIADAFQMALVCLHCLKASLKPSHNVISACPWAH